MPDEHPRIARERKTVEAMIRLYCHGEHQTPAGLCPECAELQDYARERLTRCPYQAGKPTCAKCPIHCYKPAMREKIRAVMRYAGPRMITRHPILALYHLVDGRREEPVKPARGKKAHGNRDLTRSELAVLQEIQAYWGPQNTAENVFFTEQNEAVLFVRARDDSSPVCVTLTNLGQWYEEGTISKEELRTWIEGSG